MAADKCTHVYRDTPKAREKGKVGQRCGKWQVNGTPFCEFHGGANHRTIEKAQRERFEEEIRREAPSFTEMWAEDHPLLDPFSILLWEIRRSGARIEWFDSKIEAFNEEKSIWWGISKQEEIGAAEFAGTNKTYEARENVLVKMQNEERKRLADLRRQWQDDRFEAARVAGMGAFGAAARAMIAALAQEFDIDLLDEATQLRVQHALEGLPDPIPGMRALEPTENERKARR
jgi:hypothetical protein